MILVFNGNSLVGGLMSEEEVAAKIGALRGNPEAAAATLELLQKLQSGEIPLEEVVAWQKALEEQNAVAAQRPPFPEEEAKASLEALKGAATLSVVEIGELEKVLLWCTEEVYKPLILAAGALDVLVHLLRLCTEYAEARAVSNDQASIPDGFVTIRRLILCSISEALRNDENARSSDVKELVPVVLSILKQAGAIEKGFPCDTTTANLAIQTASELLRVSAVQSDLTTVDQIADVSVLQVVRKYLRDEDIQVPYQEAPLPSLMCTSRFIMAMSVLGPVYIAKMEAAGFQQVLQAISPRNPQIKQIMLGCFVMMRGRTPAAKPRDCDRCCKIEDPKTPFMACSRCKVRRYCSKQCQIEAWKAGHCRECPALVARQSK